MRRLLRFVPRPRMKNATTPTHHVKQIAHKIVDTMQVVAPLEGSWTVLEVVAHYLQQEQRRLLREERKHGRL